MIEIGSDYSIKSDGSQLILSSRKTGLDKDGNEKDVWNKTYHPNLPTVVRAIANNKVSDGLKADEVQSLESFINGMNEWAIQILEALESGA